MPLSPLCLTETQFAEWVTVSMEGRGAQDGAVLPQGSNHPAALPGKAEGQGKPPSMSWQGHL